MKMPLYYLSAQLKDMLMLARVLTVTRTHQTDQCDGACNYRSNRLLDRMNHFSHYLHSNQAPSEKEAREIKALRVDPLEEITEIDVEIEQIESILDSLKQKRANIQKSIDDYNTILAPVRRLSTDVLGVIFTYCLATHRNPIMDSSEAPILLTQICRDWKSIALSIPRLWTRMHIPLSRSVTDYYFETLPYIHDRERRLDARSEEIQKWFRLSCACPLSITMMPTGTPVSHQPLLDAIVQSSRRWQQFELGYSALDSDVPRRILSLSADDLCILREVRLHSTADPETDDYLWHQSGVFTAQSLRSISIGNMHQIGVFPTGIPPNWKNLNHLFIHSPVVLELANQMLSHCCNLVSCLLLISWNDDVVPDASITASSFLLPHLKFLSLQGEPTNCSRLFSSMEAPSLRILDCHGNFPNDNGESGLFNFLQSIDSLETLVMDYHNLTVSRDNVLKLYSLTPSLTHLVLGQSPKQRYPRSFALYHPDPEQIKLITTLYEIKHQNSSDSAPTVLFPLLEVFEAYGIPCVTDAILLEFIKARIDAARSNTAVSNFRKVSVQFSRNRQTDIIPEALACAEAAGIGLEVDLTYYTAKELEKALSPSFGLSDMDDTSWPYPLHGY